MKFYDKNKSLASRVTNARLNNKPNIEKKIPIDIDDDDELADKVSKFNRWLAEIGKQYRLSDLVIEIMIQMFKDGQSLQEIASFAASQIPEERDDDFER